LLIFFVGARSGARIAEEAVLSYEVEQVAVATAWEADGVVE
jgi:hypothetical protein